MAQHSSTLQMRWLNVIQVFFLFPAGFLSETSTEFWYNCWSDQPLGSLLGSVYRLHSEIFVSGALCRTWKFPNQGPRVGPRPPAVGVRSLNHWTAMEVLFVILMLSLILYCDGCYILFHLYILCAYNITKLGCSNVDTHYSDVKFFVVFFIFQFQE